MSDREYSRFGPWAIEISELDPLPALFEPHVSDQDDAILSVKVPRAIERRNAHPGMDLYDHVINLYEDDLLILTREGSTARSERLAYSDLQCVHYSEDLLDGRLRLYFPKKVAELPFNSVSSVIMQKLTSLIRERFAGSMARVQDPLSEIHADPGLSFLFGNLVKERAVKTPQFRLLCAQAETNVSGSERRGFRRALFRVIGKRLTESLYYSDGRELAITHRGELFLHLGRNTYAKHTAYLPLSGLANHQWADDPENESVKLLSFELSGQLVSFGLIRDNPAIANLASFLSEASGTS